MPAAWTTVVTRDPRKSCATFLRALEVRLPSERKEDFFQVFKTKQENRTKSCCENGEG